MLSVADLLLPNLVVVKMDDINISINGIYYKCHDFVISLDQVSTSDKSVQAKIEGTIQCLQDLSREIAALDLFSVNEELEEIQTGHLKFLLVSSFLGYLIVLYENSESDRLESLDTAKDHFNAFLAQLKSYGIYSPTSSSGADSRSVDLQAQMKCRESLIRRHKEKAVLKEKISTLRSRQRLGQNLDDEIVRDLWLTELKLWGVRSEEEVFSIEKETPMLKRMNEMKAMGSSSSQSNGGIVKANKQPGLKPIILTRSELQKRVFGAGYPSLPTMTVEEWYEKMVGQGELPDRGTSSNVSGNSATNGMNEREERDREKDLMEEKNDAESLKKAREMDEYKDDHRTGWGNTYNKG